MVEKNNVSVVIVSYNTGPILPRSIESVLTQAGLCELILVNNGNPPRVIRKLEKLAKEDSRLKLISGYGNIGFAAGCNLGARQAEGKYLLLLNPDCIIPSGALAKVRDELQNHNEAWLAGCRIINPDGSEQSGSRRNILTPMVAFVETFRLYRFFPNLKLFERMNFHEMEKMKMSSIVPAISGAFMMIKKERYESLSGIDEGYFFHVEDLDFCYQVNRLGGRILYVPQISAVHFRSTSDVSSFFVEWNKARGFTRYFRKNFKGQYFPGFLTLISAGIYLRLVTRIIWLALEKLLTGQLFIGRNDAARLQELKSRLLENYASFAADRAEISASEIKNREPYLLIGATGQVGIAILRRLLALDAEVIALYHSSLVDFSHPNLIWVQGDLESDLVNLAALNPKTLIYTPALWLLPPHIKKFASLGINRIITFSSTSIFGKASSRNTYEQKLVSRLVAAEKDIADLCAPLGIKWTIFRPTMIYGIGLDRNVSSIVRFIDKLGFFPIAGPGAGLRQPVNCDDLALAVLSTVALPASFGKSYNLGGGERISYRAMVEKIFTVIGKKRRIISTTLLPLLLDIYSVIFSKQDINGEMATRMNIDLAFDDSDARRDFAYNPRRFLTAGKKDLGILEG